MNPIKNTKMKAMSALKRVKDKVIDTTAKALSAPKRAYYDAGTRVADKQYKAYKMVNDARGVQDKGNESDPLFRARVGMKAEQMKALKKQ